MKKTTETRTESLKPQIAKMLREHLAELGKKGGTTRAKRLSAAERSEIAKKAVAARERNRAERAARLSERAKKAVAARQRNQAEHKAKLREIAKKAVAARERNQAQLQRKGDD